MFPCRLLSTTGDRDISEKFVDAVCFDRSNVALRDVFMRYNALYSVLLVLYYIA
jgi:hypothetical protein